MNEKQLLLIWNKTSGHCHFCGDPVDFDKRGWNDGDLTGYWEVDHIIQHHKGGKNIAENYLPACTRCNRLRWHRTGDQVRELLFLGLIARDEINKENKIGRELARLQEKRLLENARRRGRKSPND
jgi:5-methylcytosine-specific restriction endonuclease McrA